MRFLEDTIQCSMDIWEQYVKHPFIEDIRQNKMDANRFRHYLIEDTIYLKAYARVFGMGIYKSSTMEEMRLFYEMLNFVESNENVARIKYLAAAGIVVEDIENQEPAVESSAYIQFLLRIAQDEGVLEMIFATLPCLLSYAFIGQDLWKENPAIVEENTYGDWIAEYTAMEYITKCEDWGKRAEEMCKLCNEKEKNHLQAIFRQASQHELAFWNMSYHK